MPKVAPVNSTEVGSTDFNLLGVAINYELDAIIEDRTLGREAEEMFLADLDGSREIKGPHIEEPT